MLSKAVSTAVENAKSALLAIATTIDCSATSTTCSPCAVASRAVAVPQVTAAATIHRKLSRLAFQAPQNHSK